ncbi:MAG: glycosyltransferase family 2 protein [Muribaculaceae bacterium]
MHQPLISVIIPCYNTADTLEQCLKSVAAQTYAEIEVIIVDDGSSDASPRICDRWASADARFTVIHKPNGGVASARNVGLRAANGRFIAWVDSDDYMAPHFIECLYNIISSTGADLVASLWIRVDEHDNSGIAKCSPPDNRAKLMNSDDAINDMLYQHNITTTLWSTLASRKLYSNITFPDGQIYEDLAVFYDLLNSSSSVAFTSARWYCYRRRNGSFMNTYLPQRCDVLDVLDDIAITVNQRHLPALRSRQLSAHFNILMLDTLSANPNPDIAARCWRFIRSNRGKCLCDRKVRLRNKVAALLSYLGPTAMRGIIKINRILKIHRQK